MPFRFHFFFFFILLFSIVSIFCLVRVKLKIYFSSKNESLNDDVVKNLKSSFLLLFLFVNSLVFRVERRMSANVEKYGRTENAELRRRLNSISQPKMIGLLFSFCNSPIFPLKKVFAAKQN